MPRLLALALLAVVACLAPSGVSGSLADHIYSKGDQVTLWVNKVGPFNNPQVSRETRQTRARARHPASGASSLQALTLASKRPSHHITFINSMMQRSRSHMDMLTLKHMPSSGTCICILTLLQHATAWFRPQHRASLILICNGAPRRGPQETYNYYSLPYCKPQPHKAARRLWGGLGHVLQVGETSCLITKCCSYGNFLHVTDTEVVGVL